MKEGLSTQLWVSLSVIVVFLIGLGTGVLLDARFSGSGRPPLRGLESVRGRPPLRGFESVRGRPPGRPHIWRERRAPSRMLRRLRTTLDLSEEQVERLQALSRTQREQFGEIGRDMRQQLDSRREAFRTSVADILTPAQMELFEERFRGRRGRARVSRNPRPR